MINYSTFFSLLSEGIRIPDNRSCPLAGRYLRCFSSTREVGYSRSFYIRDFVMVNAPRTAVPELCYLYWRRVSRETGGRV